MTEQLPLLALARSSHRFTVSAGSLPYTCCVCAGNIDVGQMLVGTNEGGEGHVAHEACVASMQALLHERFQEETNNPGRSRPVDYLTVEQRFRLDEACRVFQESFIAYGVYLVGSVMQRADYRDVDVRAIVPDPLFAKLYPNADPKNPARDTYWHLSMAAFSLYLRESTGLPIDFQVQQMTAANEEFQGPRNAIGLGHTRNRHATLEVS